MNFPWYLTALAAALVWGIHYPLIDNALKKLSVTAVLLLTAVPILLIAPWFRSTLLTDYRTLYHLPWAEKLPILALSVTSLSASILLFLSIESKNATLASLIEITYPMFVALFAYLLFRDVHLTPSAFTGGLLVFLGVAIIVVNNP
ncbi:MAG: EamA family transporter [Gammaproteobacteria bacterium]|nr:EamA family transporter [Gammaproteobacteria bacterium]